MPTSLEINEIVELLLSLDEKTKGYIFEKVFMVADESPLTPAERSSLKKGLAERARGGTV